MWHIIMENSTFNMQYIFMFLKKNSEYVQYNYNVYFKAENYYYMNFYYFKMYYLYIIFYLCIPN